MKCLFDKDKECPLTGQGIPVIKMGRFCEACLAKDELKEAIGSMKDELREARGSMKVMRAQLILAMLRMFPDEEDAKREYQKLMKRVEEW